jgi:hypothetical protein
MKPVTYLGLALVLTACIAAVFFVAAIDRHDQNPSWLQHGWNTWGIIYEADGPDVQTRVQRDLNTYCLGDNASFCKVIYEPGALYGQGGWRTPGFVIMFPAFEPKEQSR